MLLLILFFVGIMPLFKETLRVIQLNRERPDNGEVEPESFAFSPGCMVKIVINSISQIQIGPNGAFLNWTYLNHLSLVVEVSFLVPSWSGTRWYLGKR